MMKRILITGGGTGGHLYPALAVAEALRADPEIEIHFIGNQDRREAELVPQAGFAFHGIHFRGMPRKINTDFASWISELGQTVLTSRELLKSIQPQLIFATGGYVTGPVLLAAKTLGIPFVLHEPDAHPGLVNRRLAPWAQAVTCAFEAAKSQLKNPNIHVTGNPLRQEIGHLNPPEALERLCLSFTLEKKTLLVQGGSQGAQKINRAILEALPVLLDELGMQIIHQTGEKPFNEVKAAIPEAYQHHPGYAVYPFITDMAAAYAVSDLAVSRSGSMSLSELYQAGLPSILVPYPFAAANHQLKNALASQQQGAAKVIEDADLTGETLAQGVRSIVSDAGVFQQMQQASAGLARPEATQDVVALLRNVAAK